MATMRTLPAGFECGPYTIIEEIGRGGMAIVYLAEGPEGERCAIKTLQFARSLQPRQVKRFHREIFVVASINHVNVVRFHDAGRVVDGDTGSLMWMAQEYIDGVTLRDHIHRCGGRSPAGDVANWGEQIAGGVAAAHSVGVIHRDLKPENVMLVDAAKLIKVIDFSISKFRQWGTTTTGHKRQVVGTMGYMAPEQLNADSPDIDQRTDVYALGHILFELATGHFALAPDGQQLTVSEVLARTCAYTPPRIDARVAGFPAELADIVEKALQKRPCDRFETMAAMREALKAFETRYLTARRQAALQATDWGLASEAPAEKESGQDKPGQNKGAQNKGAQNKGGWVPGQRRTVKLATPEEALQHEARRKAAAAVTPATAPFPAGASPALAPPREMPPQPAAASVLHLGSATTQSGGRLALSRGALALNRGADPRRSRRWMLRCAGGLLGAALGFLTSGMVAPWLSPRSAVPAPALSASAAASPPAPAPQPTAPSASVAAPASAAPSALPSSAVPSSTPPSTAAPPAPIPQATAPKPSPPPRRPPPSQPPTSKPAASSPPAPSFKPIFETPQERNDPPPGSIRIF